SQVRDDGAYEPSAASHKTSTLRSPAFGSSMIVRAIISSLRSPGRLMAARPFRMRCPRDGGSQYQCAQSRRDRARHRGPRALREWGPDRAGGRVGSASPRPDHHARGPAQTAGGLLRHDRYFVAAGGLISYGPDLIDQYRQAAG